jgi:glycosyltransferase involved in cell wall biosynthesis
MLKRRPEGSEPVVTIVLKNCHNYRVPFFQQLRTVLDAKGIELDLVVGAGLPEDAAKGDVATLDWAEQRSIRTVSIFGRTLLWQPVFSELRRSDLIITEQASKQLFNVVISLAQRGVGTRHAFWGHGRNFQRSVEGGSGEGLKAWMTKRADWFFAYNELSAQAAADMGMDRDRITSVMNSTDTTTLRSVRDMLPPSTASDLRDELGLGSGPVACFIGGVYPQKRPEFLVDAAEAIRHRIPDFQMLAIGDGSSGDLFRSAAERHDWFHHFGAVYGDERGRYTSACSLQLMPGLVGLNVVDGFALGLPTVTTDIDWHSPEIEYLEDGINGLVVHGDPTPDEYAEAVVNLLQDTKTLARITQAAEDSIEMLSIEQMVENFADGVVQALGE